MGLSNPDRASATSIYTHVARLFIPRYPHALNVLSAPLTLGFWQACPAGLVVVLSGGGLSPSVSFPSRHFSADPCSRFGSPRSDASGARSASPFQLSGRLDGPWNYCDPNSRSKHIKRPSQATPKTKPYPTDAIPAPTASSPVIRDLRANSPLKYCRLRIARIPDANIQK
jgi:hypothetical protein